MVQEAVELSRKLAEQRTDAFLPELPMSLITLANILSDLGRREDALTTEELAVE